MNLQNFKPWRRKKWLSDSKDRFIRLKKKNLLLSIFIAFIVLLGKSVTAQNERSVADSFSLHPELNLFFAEKTCYSENSNLTNQGFAVSSHVEFLARKFPVSGTAFWNPETKVGVLQPTISIF
jgi:hypothetical protein